MKLTNPGAMSNNVQEMCCFKTALWHNVNRRVLFLRGKHVGLTSATDIFVKLPPMKTGKCICGDE